MFIAFAVEGIGIYALSVYGHNPLLFVILTGLVFFAWGEIYSLFPATCGDTFGSKYAATNAGLLYTAKGTAALIVPYTSVLTTNAVFLAAAGLNILAALMALPVLKPMRKAYVRPTRGMPRLDRGSPGPRNLGVPGPCLPTPAMSTRKCLPASTPPSLAALDALATAVIVVDAEMRIVVANAAAEAIVSDRAGVRIVQERSAAPPAEPS